MEYLVDVSTLALSLVLVGFLTETVVELLKNLIPTKLQHATALYALSIVVGIALCIVLEISIFEKENLSAYYLGALICGLVASRGSNYVHNWLDTLPRKVSK